MLRTHWRSIPLIIAVAGFCSSATAAALDAGYLVGNWQINAPESCGGKQAEHLVIQGDGSFEYNRRGRAEAVGFWRVEGDVLVFDMLTVPASFQDIHAELQPFAQYETYSMRAMPIDMQQDQFSLVASMGDQMQRFSLRRCQ